MIGKGLAVLGLIALLATLVLVAGPGTPGTLAEEVDPASKVEPLLRMRVNAKLAVAAGALPASQVNILMRPAAVPTSAPDRPAIFLYLRS